MADRTLAELDPVERELLSLGTEDWYQVWYALSTAKELLPGLSEAALLQRAKESLRRLVREGLLRIVLFDYIRNEEVPTTDTFDQLIDHDAMWELATRYKPHVCFTATEHGEQVYFALPPRE